MVRTGKIADVKAKALRKPSGYLEDVKAHSILWDEEAGIYQMTEEVWQNPEMRAKWKAKIEPSIDVCKYRTCGGCASGPQCKSTYLECSYGPGTFHRCEIWRKENLKIL